MTEGGAGDVKFPKPQSDWVVISSRHPSDHFEALSEQVQQRLEGSAEPRPGGRVRTQLSVSNYRATPDLSVQLLARELDPHLSRHSCSGATGRAGATTDVSGQRGGSRQNRLRVRRTLAERITLAAIREKLALRENLAYVMKRVEEELSKANSAAPESIRLKEADLEGEERRVANFVQFIGEGRGSRALADALLASEQRCDELKAELELLKRGQEAVSKFRRWCGSRRGWRSSKRSWSVVRSVLPCFFGP